MLCKKSVLENFVKLTGKNLCRSFPVYFSKFLKTHFFIELLRWLLLLILKPLDSQRQLCKWVSKLVTIYFISTFLVLVGIFCVCSWRAQACLLHHTIEVLRDFLSETPSSWLSTLPSFGGHEPCECGDKTFLIYHLTTWSMCHLTLWVGSFILSHHTAKFRVHRPCESGNTTFFIYQITAISNCHVTV